jgi:hypothetical protein
MSDVLSSDLHKKVERYEAAVDELRASHAEIRDILVVDVLFERWKQLGSDLGFGAGSLPDWQPRQAPGRSGHAIEAGGREDVWES